MEKNLEFINLFINKSIVVIVFIKEILKEN